ncbi:MAG TPA: hypothetical protein VF575_04280 [Candidatus Saccharimonadales bacterium]|jgi:hypothetical protein
MSSNGAEFPFRDIPGDWEDLSAEEMRQMGWKPMEVWSEDGKVLGVVWGSSPEDVPLRTNLRAIDLEADTN